ncbi:MAG: methyltransferase domain-containing protein [Emcibacter sp.]|nr:methyltransferase domain-containing protein [Emcibacter sp.]
MAVETQDIKVPLKLRLSAWWNGYDIDDVKEQLKALADDGTGGKDAPSSDAKEETSPAIEETVSSLKWDKLRIEMSQLIWGDGYCGPGGKEHIAKMCKLLAMNSQMSAIVVGAGLGGPARVLTEEFGVWVTGFELSKDLAEQGMQMSTDLGLASKAIITHMDPEEEEPFDRRYDRAFSKEALYCFPDKTKILKDTFETLKEGALFLLTDYTISDISVLENPEVQKWLKQEATQPYLVTADTMKTTLEKVGFSIRVNEDISTEYVELIESSWSKAATVAKQLAKKKEEGAAAIKSLMMEAEHWALRAKLLKEGHIHVWRFLANKPNEEIR